MRVVHCFPSGPGHLEPQYRVLQGVFMRNFILTFISHLQRVCSWRGAINSILFINAVCEARPGTRAEAGTMSSLENYKWVYLAFQRRLDVTRISRYGIKEYLLWCQATVPPHNSILPWSKLRPSVKSSFQLNENAWAGLRSEAAKRPLGARPQQRNLNFKFWNYKFYCYAFA